MDDGRKIAIIGSAWPLRGGLAAFNERLATEYLRNGDRVTIYTFSLQYPDFLFPGKTQYSDAPAPKELDICVQINTVNPVTWVRTGKEIRAEQPDLVIIKYWIPFVAPSLGKIARLIRKNKKTKVVSIIDNIIPHEKRLGDKMLSKYWVNSVDGFVAMSKNVLNDLNIFDQKKPKVFCPHPLYDHYGPVMDKEKAKLALGLRPERHYLLFFGFIRDYKGLDILLKAINPAFFEAHDLQLLVAGEFYTDAKPYFEIIRQRGLDDLVIMSNDFIPDEKVSLYFNACDVVVQPYKDATQSGVTQIAYHFEKPVITTNVGGLAEIVPNNEAGFVTSPVPESIDHAIRRFYEENKMKAFEQKVRELKAKYSWQNMLKAIDAVAKK